MDHKTLSDILHLVTPSRFWDHTPNCQCSTTKFCIKFAIWKICTKFGHLILRKIFKFVATREERLFVQTYTGYGILPAMQ